MNNFTAIGMLTLLISSSLVHSAPTRMFNVETPEIAAIDSVSIDVEYPFLSGGTSTSLRVGTQNGELFLNNNRSGLTTTSIGYKGAIIRNIALFTTMSHITLNTTTNSSLTEISVGATTAINMETLTLVGSAELISADSSTTGSDNIIFLRGAIDFPTNNILENSSLIAELRLDNDSAVNTYSSFGARWQPTKRLTIDMIIYSKNGSSIIAIPGYVILNFVF